MYMIGMVFILKAKWFIPNKAEICFEIFPLMSVQSHLEHCVQFWAPQLKKMLRYLNSCRREQQSWWKSWKEWPSRLKTLALLALEKRRVRGDLCSPYSLLRRGTGQKGPEHFPWHPGTRHMGRAQSNVRGSSGLTLWNILHWECGQGEHQAS